MKLAFLFLLLLGFVNEVVGQQPSRNPRDKRGLGIQPSNATKSESESASKEQASRERPELVIQSGHTGQVTAIAFAPNGTWLATGSSDSTIRIWDVESGTELRALTGHTGSISRLVISADGQRLVSTTWKVIKVWDVTNGAEVHSFPTGFQVTPAISPDLRLLAAVQDDGLLKIWELLTGKELPDNGTRPKDLKSIAFSPDGRSLAMGTSQYTIQILDPQTGTELLLLGNLSAWATSLAFSPDGKRLASGNGVMSYRDGPFGGKIPLGLLDGAVSMWDIEGRKQLWIKPGHKDHVNSLSFSSDGRWLISTNAGDDRKKLAWNTADGSTATWKLFRIVEPGNIPSTFNRDGSVIATGKQVRNLSNSVELWAMQDAVHIQIHALEFSPDSRLLAAGFGHRDIGGVNLYDAASGKLVRELTAQTRPINLSAFPPNGQFLAVGQQDDLGISYGGTKQRIHLWDVSTGVPVQTVAWPIAEDLSSISFQADGKRFAVLVGRQLQTFDVTTGGLHREFGLYSRMSGNSQSLSGDGRRMIAKEAHAITVWDPESGTQLRKIETQGVVQDIALSPSGKQIATLGFGNRKDINELRLIDTETGQLLRMIETPPRMWRIVFSADGRQLAGGVLNHGPERVMIWSAETGKVVQSFSIPDQELNPSSIVFLAFSGDGSVLAAADATSAVTIWDLRQGKLLSRTRGHTRYLSGLSFSPDGRLLTTSSLDGTAIVWDVESGNELARLFSLKKGSDWLVMTPDGLFDGSAGSWSGVLWRFGGKTFDTAPVEAFFNEFYYPGLLGEILSGSRPKAPRSINQIDRRQPLLRLSPREPLNKATDVSLRQIDLTIDVSEAAADTVHSSGSGVQDVRLFRNGSLVRAWRGHIKLDTSGRAVVQATVPIVAGENRFNAYAFNRDNIKSLDTTLSINGDEKLRRKGTAYVIAVGINRYSNSSYDLKYAVADAQGFGAEIAQQQTRIGNYERVIIIPLLDSEATKSNILEALRRLRSSEAASSGVFPTVLQNIKPAEPEDAVIVFFASHGLARGDRFYLIPTDMGYTGPRARLTEQGLKTIISRSISDVEFEEAFEKVDARQLLLVIDACNSGQALEAEEKRRGPMNSKGLAQLAYEKGMYVLTAAQGYQAALEAAQLGHGYLTYALVEEGLKTKSADTSPADGQVFIREWLDYATRRVPQMQQIKIQEQQKQGRQLEMVLKFAETDTGTQRSVQRPRVFYRREVEINPLVVAKP